jgi:hypothetical protein
VVRFFYSTFSCNVFRGLTEGFVVVETECDLASYRGRGRERGAVTTVQ